MSRLFSFKVCAAVVTALALPCVASAQSYDSAAFAQHDGLEVQASVTFKIPLGSTDRRRMLHQPRLGFGLSLAKNDFDSPMGPLGTDRLTILDVGAYGFRTPSLQLSGQEIYGSTFVVLNADETDGEINTDADDAGGSDTGLILIAGAAVVASLGTIVLINEAADDFNDCFLVFTDVPDKCRD
ncbi:hypothetical protein GCM10011309_14470 [Litorimonas cladophorae]|uniref:Uncharacterized protein n=1 Tax=Litorimonas cladophorae TaxID=1220491 RepID=A0A918KJ34_9PROT|nr:hypothetical protein [Litorimonas cladophorae]GGX65313.1 hypothetical protein GCM10011309_14470 [Litorimonas cladophorae]